jgi:N utilization substance protein A
MVAVSGVTFGPLSEDLLRRQVDVDIVAGIVEIYYDRELRARFDQATGDRLPLDEGDDTAGEFASASEQLMS